MKNTIDVKTTIHNKEYFIDYKKKGDDCWKNYAVAKTKTQAERYIEDMQEFWDVRIIPFGAPYS